MEGRSHSRGNGLLITRNQVQHFRVIGHFSLCHFFFSRVIRYLTKMDRCRNLGSLLTDVAWINTGTDMAVRNAGGDTSSSQVARGMVLPFQPLSLAFNHVNYYVDMPAVSLSN